MIAIKPIELEGVVEIEVTGKISEHDIREFDSYIHQKKEAGKEINLLMELHKLEGYSVKGFFEDLKFEMNHWKDFNKIAIVSDKKWVEVSTKISDLLPNITLKYFKEEEKSAAIEWLK